MSSSARPILVCMVWRGGQRFRRCLASIQAARMHFERVVLSVTSEPDSPDMELARQAREADPNLEVICTERELPTMEHQAFWIDYLQRTGVRGTDWIYWLAYDDEVRTRGIEAIVDPRGGWPLEPGTAYFGPWAMRHESPDELWSGDDTEELESWTSFPVDGPLRLPVSEWIRQQLQQPTYMQMSGSVNPFQSFVDLKERRPRKRGPMRIEMATAAAPGTSFVQEFPEPVSIIYGRSNSDRASYGRSARWEDAHLASWLARHSTAHPNQAVTIARSLYAAGSAAVRSALGVVPPAQEEWRVRGSVTP
mgnify:CR=1 FL=1